MGCFHEDHLASYIWVVIICNRDRLGESRAGHGTGYIKRIDLFSYTWGKRLYRVWIVIPSYITKINKNFCTVLIYTAAFGFTFGVKQQTFFLFTVCLTKTLSFPTLLPWIDFFPIVDVSFHCHQHKVLNTLRESITWFSNVDLMWTQNMNFLDSIY